MPDIDPWEQFSGPPLATTWRPGAVQPDGVTVTVDALGVLSAHGGGGGGGLAVPSGQSGGVPYYNTTTSLLSSAPLAANAIVLGGGVGQAPISLAGLGTAGQVLTSAGPGAAPVWNTITGGGGGGSGTVTSVSTGAGLTGGPITASGTISLATIGAGLLLANATGGTSTPIGTTLTAVLDAAFGTAQGSIVYRGTSAWAALGPGTSGNVLQTQGPGASPVWASVGSGSGTITLTGDVSGSGTGTINVTLPTVNSTVGTYPKVTVNAKGQVTAGLALTAADLPVATVSALGAVRPDGTTITISGGVLSSVSGGAGTVTSVNVSGGTTGLVSSGGPVTTSGTITLSGTLAIANGGTGATSAAAALTALGAAPLASPALTGTPTAPTAAAGTNTTQLASTAFVQTASPIATSSVAGRVKPSADFSVAGDGTLTIANATAPVANAFMGWNASSAPTAKTLYRAVSGTTDTPTAADHLGTVEYTSASAVTVTANWLGAGISYVVRRSGAGTVTVAAGSGVTLASDNTSPSYSVAAQKGTLVVFCEGTTNAVSVNGKMA